MHSKVRLCGEFQYRILKNYTRLMEKEYRPEFMFRQTAEGYSWPGDWEGRAILALVLLKDVTGAEPAYLEQILQMLSQQLVQNGYLGEPYLDQNRISEQQLAGHNWLLRGLMEASIRDPRPFLKEMVTRMIEQLFLPVMGAYRKYPLGECRSRNGEASGTLQEDSVNGWFLSTDIGCAYIPLDALSQYYQVYRDKRILPLLDEMVETFMEIDYLGESLQTHASLSATRGIVRLYQETGEKRYLEFARRFFELYCREGMTENYANYNWFRRPTWTEPCAIVDSYLLAMELFKILEDTSFLNYANKILYNALGHAQRSNGGFGCDMCAVSDGENELLYAQEENYEALWCCSMRGAEGLSYAAKNAFLQRNGRGVFTNYLAGKYEFDGLQFTVDTRFPYDGLVRFQFEQCPENFRLQCYLPEHTDQNNIGVWLDRKSYETQVDHQMLAITIPGPCELTLKIPLQLHVSDSLHLSKKNTCWYGLLQLGCDAGDSFDLDNLSKWKCNENGDFVFEEHLLYPINQSIYMAREELLERRTRILF